ncbi:MAG TPA: hypothetical protein VNN74_08100 [Candidatus Micrarchaeia archaeon]|nr:hypothetical protein [Candidatus Micrarchaeia archaeon]
MTAVPHLRGSGAAREGGRRCGAGALDRVHRSRAATRDRFRARAAWEWPTVLAEARAGAPPLAASRPAHLGERAAPAVGAGADRDDILALTHPAEIPVPTRRTGAPSWLRS